MTGKSEGWTLIARFSNDNVKNWMHDNGLLWYEQLSPLGNTIDPGANNDMISPAFWSSKGSEFKITRSDDKTHTALLVTKNNCLDGQTFREKITSYGDFRKGAVWAVDRCLGNCSVIFGGQYRYGLNCVGTNLRKRRSSFVQVISLVSTRRQKRAKGTLRSLRPNKTRRSRSVYLCQLVDKM